MINRFIYNIRIVKMVMIIYLGPKSAFRIFTSDFKLRYSLHPPYRQIMQRNEDVRHLTDFLDGIPSFGKIDMHSGRDGRAG